MILLDKMAYSSKLRDKSSTLKLIFALSTLVACLWADSRSVSVFIILLMGWAAVGRGGTPLSYYLKLMLVPCAFLFLGVLTIIIDIGDRGFWTVKLGGFFFSVSAQGVEMAFNLVLRALGAVSCLYFLTLTTSIMDIISVLKRWKMPALFLELMMLIYRFIFILLEVLNRMHISEQARLGNAGMKARFRGAAGIASSLFICSMRKGEGLFNAMEARGYDGEIRVPGQTDRGSKKEWACLLAFDGILLIIILLIKLEGGAFL